MGCISTKQSLSQVQQVHPKGKEEKFHEFGLKKQDSFRMYDSHNPRGIISMHIQKKQQSKSQSLIKTNQKIFDLEDGCPTASKVATTDAGKRTSIMTSQLGTPNMEKFIQTTFQKIEPKQLSKENTPVVNAQEC